MEGVKTHMGIIDVFKGERNVIPKQEVKPFQVSQKQWRSSGDSRTNERRAEMERELDNDKLAWKSIKDDGLPPVGSCLIVTIKNHGYGGRRELRYPVHYLEKNYAPGYAFYMNGTDILLPEYSEVVAWMPIPMPYEGE